MKNTKKTASAKASGTAPKKAAQKATKAKKPAKAKISSPARKTAAKTAVKKATKTATKTAVKKAAKKAAKTATKAAVKKAGKVAPKVATKAAAKAKGAKVKRVAGNKLVLAGVGASAGGLEALRLFVAELPKNVNMAYVVAQHMSPAHRSMMVDLLSRETMLTVCEVKNGIVPKADTVYVCPSNSDVFFKGGKLRLRKPLSDIGAKPSVDYLFSSMAEELGERAIGIVMSGTGSDGSHGIRAINAAGGICIAQDPETAKYDSMPLSAVKAGVDLILPPADIAAQLTSIIKRPRVKVSDGDDNKDPINPVESIVKNIYVRTRMDFSNYKETTITRQIERRMAVLQMTDLEQYVKFSEDQPGELEALATNFLICVTSFFRDKDAFEAFRDVIRETLKTKKPGDDIRIWVPGCATGEEAYSIAIILAEELGNELDHYRVQVFATDVNSQATQFGRKGLYPETSIENLDPRILRKYFLPKDRFFQVDRKIRDMVVFANQDLVQDPPFVRVDAITCRNLLIYFKTGLQEKVFRIFHYALNPEGVLFLGQSESVGQNANLFIDLNRKLKLFRKRDVPSSMPTTLSGAPLAALPSRRQAEITAKENAKEPQADPGRGILFEAYAPPSVLVSEDGSIVEFYGDMTPFMQLKPGKADFSMFSIIHPPLRTELRAIMQKVGRSKETTHTRPVPMVINGEERMIRTAVRPVESKVFSENLVLVSFEPANVRVSGTEIVDGLDETAETRISELEHELTMTRESLQTVIEELETSNEELQSLNEESQAANEELQASNEELETSNEELQATNEELTTVNDELSLRTRELAEAIDDLENIQDSSDLATLVVDQDLNIRRQNKRAQDFFKIDPGLGPQNLASVPVLFNLEGFLERAREVGKSSKPYFAEFSNKKRHYELQIFPYQSDQPQNGGGAIINIRDISQRVDADNLIKESEQRFRAVIDNASSEVMLKDTEGCYQLVNRKFLENHGLKEKDVIGKRLKDLYNAAVSKPFRDLEEKVLSTGISQHGELMAPLEDYPARALLSTKFPIRDTSGEIVGIGTVNTDISSLRKAIEDLEQAKQAADTANKAKSDFLSSMSHELRTPLNAILGFGQLLDTERSSLNKQEREYIAHILDGGRHLLELVNQVLDLARIESGAISLSIEPVAIEDVTGPCMVMASALSERYGVSVESTLKVPKNTMVQADLVRAKQVLLNLLANAIKYNRPGGTVTLGGRKTRDGMWRFSVTDTGIGIAKNKHNEVFEPFHRLAIQMTTVEGTGIGLTIAKELVESMGGAIDFTSVEGEGSTFWFDLPLSDEVYVAKMLERTVLKDAATNTAPNFPPNTKVLYIEDNPQNRELMEGLIRNLEGLILITAEDAETGIELCRSERPDVVLMDIHLPGMNGIEATKVLKADAMLKHIPVVAVSAIAMGEDIQSAIDAGMCEYQTKPFKIDAIASAIRRALSDG